jgi:hypothetical protein
MAKRGTELVLRVDVWSDNRILGQDTRVLEIVIFPFDDIIDVHYPTKFITTSFIIQLDILLLRELKYKNSRNNFENLKMSQKNSKQ